MQWNACQLYELARVNFNKEKIKQKEFNISNLKTHFTISHLAIFETSLMSFKNVYYFNLVHVAIYKI